MFTALLDANVLWPSLRRDLLLSLAIEGLYQPVWSWRLLEEVEYGETAKLIKRGSDPDQAAQRAAWLISEMRSAFDDAEVEGWESLEGTFKLPDPDDEHVAAAAVIAGAGVIVTENDKDFPEKNLRPHGIEVLRSAAFASNTVAVAPRRAVAAVDAIAARSGKQGQRRTRTDVLDLLDARYGFTDATALIRQAQQDDSR